MLTLPLRCANHLRSSISTPSTCPTRLSQVFVRCKSGTTQWKQRQQKDVYAREAKVNDLRSRAAFKLIEINDKYKIFRKNQTVVDLGYAPGSWSQVAVSMTKPHGRVIGIDLLPASPPPDVSTFQGNFLSPVVQEYLKRFITDTHRRKPIESKSEVEEEGEGEGPEGGEGVQEEMSYIDRERHETDVGEREVEKKKGETKLVDVILSDMSAPWDQTVGFSSNTLSNPYHRLMNTSGNDLRDHEGSMELCHAAFDFAKEMLKPKGTFVCKYYAGANEGELKTRLKGLFRSVHEEKPKSSRGVSTDYWLKMVGEKKRGRVC